MRKKDELNFFKTRPKVEPIDVDTYLRRIGLKQEVATLTFLKKLHKNHLEKIPFENLDIPYRKKIFLDVKRIYDKVIHRKRGGFCYELNLLFYHLLVWLGYECILTSARLKTENGWSDAFDHMIIIVRLDGKYWLADVGFGDLFVYPRGIEEQSTQLDYDRYFHIRTEQDLFILRTSTDLINQRAVYSFRIEPVEFILFLDRCNYHQESKNSIWTNQKMITQLFPEGRITLTDRKLTVIQFGRKEEIAITNEDEFLAKLSQHFGIDGHSLIFQDAS